MRDHPRRPPRGSSSTGPLLAGVVLAATLAVSTLAAGLTPYRRAEWKHWIVPGTGTHPRADVRQLVLARDARPGSATWDDEERKVTAGAWINLYAEAEVLTDPGELDVDHLIPLSKAHQRGGWRWDRARKSEYANFLGYRWHLIAVGAHENRSKGDQGPDTWRPTPAFWCQYGEAWAVVAVLWRLEVTEAERAALAELVATC